MTKENQQTPLGSGFNAKTTAQEVIDGIDLAGKTAIVTGGHSGLGLETVRVLASAGASVIVPVRNQSRAIAVLRGLPRVKITDLDLLNPRSIDSFAQSVLDSGSPVHILVNNAGVMAAPLTRDARGFESQFATNHLGHFQLTNRLWPALCAAEGARVVALSSRAHRFSPMDFDDTHFNRKAYDKWIAYGQSKTANALFSVALDRRGKGHGVRAFSVHPGSIVTDLSRYLSDEELGAFGVRRAEPKCLPLGQSVQEGGDFRTVEQGAATTVWCASSPLLNNLGGLYCENCDVAQLVTADSPSATGVCTWAVDQEQAEQLWSLSEQATNRAN